MNHFIPLKIVKKNRSVWYTFMSLTLSSMAIHHHLWSIKLHSEPLWYLFNLDERTSQTFQCICLFSWWSDKLFAQKMEFDIWKLQQMESRESSNKKVWKKCPDANHVFQTQSLQCSNASRRQTNKNNWIVLIALERFLCHLGIGDTQSLCASTISCSRLLWVKKVHISDLTKDNALHW